MTALVATVALGCGPQLRRPAVPEPVVREERLKQQELAVSLTIQRAKRLYDVAARIELASAELCGDETAFEYGMFTAAPVGFLEEFRDAARNVLGGGAAVRILHVVAGSPADAAGLREGDEVVQVDGVPAEPVTASRDEISKEILEALGKRSEKGEIRLVVRRDGELVERTLRGRKACKYPVALVNSDAVNAFANGTAVGITSGMLRFVESDDELALVVGHELAHNILGHLSRRQANTLAGTLLGLVLDIGAAAAGVNTQGVGMRIGGQAGSLIFSKEFEAEADYLGTYMAARAGYRIDDAAMFWRRMAVEHPASIGSGQDTFLRTHPTTPERATALERTIEEIKTKIALGQPLVPERLRAEEAASREDTGAAAQRPGRRRW